MSNPFKTNRVPHIKHFLVCPSSIRPFLLRVARSFPPAMTRNSTLLLSGREAGPPEPTEGPGATRGRDEHSRARPDRKQRRAGRQQFICWCYKAVGPLFSTGCSKLSTQVVECYKVVGAFWSNITCGAHVVGLIVGHLTVHTAPMVQSISLVSEVSWHWHPKRTRNNGAPLRNHRTWHSPLCHLVGCGFLPVPSGSVPSTGPPR